MDLTQAYDAPPATCLQELYALEDLVADFVEVQALVAGETITKRMILHLGGNTSAASRLYNLINLSVAMAGDAAFARQARRKFV
eukprot:COSAG06_NODE_1639_length_8832_cov_33.453515_10_plen_84_part_00